jgi:hypothetical protein
VSTVNSDQFDKPQLHSAEFTRNSRSRSIRQKIHNGLNYGFTRLEHHIAVSIRYENISIETLTGLAKKPLAMRLREQTTEHNVV